MSNHTDPAAVRPAGGRWPCVRSSSPSNTHPPSPGIARHRTGLVPLHRLDDADYATLAGRLPKEAGAEPDVPGLPAGVEAVTRHASDGRHWRVLLNQKPKAVLLPDPAQDLLTDALAHELPPGGCAVLRGY